MRCHGLGSVNSRQAPLFQESMRIRRLLAPDWNRTPTHTELEGKNREIECPIIAP